MRSALFTSLLQPLTNKGDCVLHNSSQSPLRFHNPLQHSSVNQKSVGAMTAMETEDAGAVISQISGRERAYAAHPNQIKTYE